jgi:cell division protein FtsA
MKHIPELFIKICDSEIYLIAGYIEEQNNFHLIEKLTLPNIGTSKNKISDLEKNINSIKKSIFLIEQRINYTFKDLIIILNDLEISFLNLSGFKKLNGTQISKENITYILNALKSYVDEFEKNKKILHIFNSYYCLDKKKLDNLPIGLFGDFYSHELSFNLINENDFKNLESIFKRCNLKIKKILLESFVKGSIISDKNSNIDTFLHIQLNEKNTKVFYVENDSIKFEQKFKFGTDIIANDISKITSLDIKEVKQFIKNNSNLENVKESDLLEKEYFKEDRYRKIKKKLIIDIAEARIKELFEILFYENINFKGSLKKIKIVFLETTDELNLNCFKKIYKEYFLIKNKLDLKFIKKFETEEIIDAACKIVHFGWKKEAIPVAQLKKSLFSRLFDKVFS